MEHVVIPGTELRVGRVALGTWAIGGWMWGGTEEREAIGAINAALDAGITLIDTAPVYGFGRAEEIVGKALAERGGRDAVVIATKIGLEWSEGGRITRNSSPARIREEIEASLRRLRTEYIDLYQVHWPDVKVPFETTAAELERLREEGKVQALGVSNFTPRQMDLFRKAAPLASCQPPYNLFERGAEATVLPYCAQAGVVVLGYGALCRGLLSGAVTADRVFGGDDLRRFDPKFKQPRLGHYLKAVERLEGYARDRYGVGVLALAVRWVLDRGVDVALWGARRPSQLDALEAVFSFRLDDDGLRQIEAIVAEEVEHPVGPEFMAPSAR